MTIEQLIRETLDLLQKNKVESDRFELKLLLSHILQQEPKEISTQETLNQEQISQFNKMIRQRKKRKPIDKIIGEKGFYKYDFIVNNDVLSPRADTEILVESVINLLKNQKNKKILELGVGSGCILLSILSDLLQIKGVGVDISKKALKVTRANAKKLDICSKRLKLINLDWFDDNIFIKLPANFDVIISNPPYIRTKELEKLEPEVLFYDPQIALDGGKDGLKDYKRIIQIAQQKLKKGGFLFLEAGDLKQLNKISNIAQSHGFTHISILNDLQEHPRCIILKK